MTKSKQEIVEETKAMSFAEEIEQDKQQAGQYIERAAQARTQLGEDHPTTHHEEAAIGLYKRALMLLGAGNLEITNANGITQNASRNGLPISSYLTHGSRVLVEIPAGSEDKMINWLTSGYPNVDGRSTKYSQQGALSQNRAVYSRLAATHDISITTQATGEFTLQEQKTGLGGFIKDVWNRLTGRRAHYGADLALGAEFNKTDSKGQIVSRPDGEHGHMYIHYIPPTPTKPGGILIGVEGFAPSSSSHSKLGKSDSISATKGSKFEDLDTKKEIADESEYSQTIVPRKYNGMHVKLDTESLESITALSDQNYGKDLASRIPSSAVKDFVAHNIQHQKPEFKASKSLQQIQKPNITKRLLNGFVKIVSLTILQPYQNEIDTYNQAHKKQKLQNLVKAKETMQPLSDSTTTTTTIDHVSIEKAKHIGNVLRATSRHNTTINAPKHVPRVSPERGM